MTDVIKSDLSYIRIHPPVEIGYVHVPKLGYFPLSNEETVKQIMNDAFGKAIFSIVCDYNDSKDGRGLAEKLLNISKNK